MNKTALLAVCAVTLSLQSFAMEKTAEPSEGANPFDLIGDHEIQNIAAQGTKQAAGRLRGVSRRFNELVWHYDKPCEIRPWKDYLVTDQTETDQMYWKRVYEMIAAAQRQIGRFKAHNEIILYPRCAIFPTDDYSKLSLPAELAHMNIDGLRINCDYVKASQVEKLPQILPNLKFLDLTGSSDPYVQVNILPSTLSQLTKLHTLTVARYRIPPEGCTLIPQSIVTLELKYCNVWFIHLMAIANLTSLRSLSLAANLLFVESLEKLAPLAPHLEKLNISFTSIAELPQCLASFEKLEELDISGNELKKDALNCIAGLKNLKLLIVPNSKTACLDTSMVPKTVTIRYGDGCLRI